MLRKSLVLLTLLACFVVGGCSDENPLINERAETLPLDDLVIANCYAVEAAAEAFAAENDGFFPFQRSELIAHLPQGTRLENPYTNLLNVPLDGTAASPGETRYRSYVGIYGDVVGYFITGFGAAGELVSLSNLPRDVFFFEDQTIANCYAVLAAVEAFVADNNGVYPSNVSGDTNLLGNQVTDYLPGSSLLTNPYTLAATEPIDGFASSPGQTAYFPISGPGGPVSCWVTGFGRHDLIIIIGPMTPEDIHVKASAYWIMKAVEDFAAESSGVYPNDVDTDVSLSGNTVIDLLWGGRKRNPYTEEATEPRNGLVTTRGQIGYVSVSNGGANEGYIINGWGLFGEVVRLEK